MTACLIANQLIAGTPDGSRTVDNPKSGGGIAISASDASRMAQSYPGDKPINPRQGFFLSKAALDSIFQHDESATGIMLVPVRDEGDNLNLVVKGYRSEKIVVDSRAGNSVFLMQMYCPTDCEMLNQLGKE
jgi:hypothetical protein